jgi:hypothetical protein
MTAAPTMAEIIARSAELSISCEKCRAIRSLHRLPADMVAAGRGDVAVDQLTFRCGRCKNIGQPYVAGPGNAFLGRAQLWPPVLEDEQWPQRRTAPNSP